MDLIKITKETNGILFDTAGLAVVKPDAWGVTISKKMFVPSNEPSISEVHYYNDRVVVQGNTTVSYSLNLDGSNGAQPISHIEGSPVSSIEDIFDKFIAIL
jgi:hypothetical protein